ncbi:MAG: 4Fe-4S dicluster domain-containing protein [bacterium]
MVQIIVSYNIESPADEYDVTHLAEKLALCGHDVWRVPELYHVPDEEIDDFLFHFNGDIVYVTQLHIRAAEWMLRKHSDRFNSLTIFSTRENSDLQHLGSEICTQFESTGKAGLITSVTLPNSPRWYPVIDRGRCVNCGRCRQFCLFGVYIEKLDGTISADNPDRCKTGCPACSRICPQGAIIFPLYNDDAVSGAPGLFMTPDLKARRFYLQRTAQPCPKCGTIITSTSGGSEGEGSCSECGSPYVGKEAEIDAEIMSLINDLEDYQKRGDA